MFALTTLRSRLLALGAASLFGLLMAGGFGLFQLARLDRGVAIDLAQMGRAVDIVLDVQNAGIDFKTQVQEWKNTLLRGRDAKQRERFWTAFQKNEAEVAKRTAELASTFDPARTLVIGDTTHDLLMARHAGCESVAVTYGAHPLHELLAARPKAHCASVEELTAWLACHA